MKNFKTTFLFMALFAMALAITSCNNKAKESTEEGEQTEAQARGIDDGAATKDGEKADAKSMEYASAYVCPMHCKGSGSHEAGKCPVCGMDYVMNDGRTRDDDGGADGRTDGQADEGQTDDRTDGEADEGQTDDRADGQADEG